MWVWYILDPHSDKLLAGALATTITSLSKSFLDT